MGQDVKSIRKIYDSLAREYAQQFAGEHEKKPMDREVLGRFAAWVGDKRPVWDLGCGPGQTTRYLRDLGVHISGLDLSEKILEQARTRHPGIFFQQGNILNLGFADNSIAASVAFYAIVHFTPEQVETAFREIFRVLQPGGLLLLTFHTGDRTMRLEEFLGKKVDIDFMFFSTDFISGCLKKIGFENMDIIDREPYPELEYPSRRAYFFATKP